MVLKNEQILVSVIIPIYNSEKYLSKCIESVKRQSYINLEIILIDDGSTDGSAKICKKYANTDKRIKFFRQRNQGVSSARNNGLKFTTGDYITFVDSDDSVEINFIESMIQLLSDYSFDLIISTYKSVYEDKGIQINEFNETLTYDIKHDFYKLRRYFNVPWGKLYKREIIAKNDINFPVDFTDAEDQVFNFEFLRYVKSYCLVNNPAYNYYHRKTMSLSKLRTLKSFESNLKKIYYEKIFLDELEIKNKEYILTDSCCFMINHYSSISDINNCYCLFKDRIKVIKSLLYDFKHYKNFKRYVILNCIRYNIFLPLYLYYNFKKFVRERL